MPGCPGETVRTEALVDIGRVCLSVLCRIIWLDFRKRCLSPLDRLGLNFFIVQSIDIYLRSFKSEAFLPQSIVVPALRRPSSTFRAGLRRCGPFPVYCRLTTL